MFLIIIITLALTNVGAFVILKLKKVKKVFLIISVIILTFVEVKADTNNWYRRKDDVTFVKNVLRNEVINLNDSTCYHVRYGKQMVYLSIYKDGYIRHYELKDGYVYSVTDIFPDGIKYYGPEKD